MKALVIEDSERLRRSLQIGLSRSGFTVDAVGCGNEGLSYAQFGRYDIVVLDLMLPGLDGLSVLRRLREEQNGVHVLVLSARDQVADRIAGLQIGADDYLVKPFDFDELVARMRALVRRKFVQKSPVHRAGPVEIDLGRKVVTCAGRTVELSGREFSVLEHLVLRRGQVVSKSELLDHLYSGGDCGSDNTVEVFVHQVRKKLRQHAGVDVVRTRRGLGYVVE
ncbi:MAG: response regulator transcription factor [Planctomycetes bacterium]|nr:response regulator transcription factor [Planctomycetota bacterium]